MLLLRAFASFAVLQLCAADPAKPGPDLAILCAPSCVGGDSEGPPSAQCERPECASCLECVEWAPGGSVPVAANGLAEKSGRRLESGAESGEEEKGKEGKEEEREEKEEEEEKEGEGEEEEEEEEFSREDVALGMMLLGFVTFVMWLFTLVNHYDKDMVFYTWQVISSTISIFVAVLMFSSINAFVHETLVGESTMTVHGIADLVQMILYLLSLQVVTGVVSGVFEKDPFQNVMPHQMQEYREYRETQILCWATLLAHMTGFSSINFGGWVQHLPALQAHPFLTFLIAPVMYVGHIYTGRTLRQGRKTIIAFFEKRHAKDEAGDVEHSEVNIEMKKKWEDTVVEAMNDVAALNVSFLTVQACRLNITGVLPNNMGIEEEHWLHDITASVLLFMVAVFFAASTIAMVRAQSTVVEKFGKDPVPFSFGSIVKRMVDVLAAACGFAMALCLMYTTKWEMARHLSGVLGNPNALEMRIVMAAAMSVLAFVVISCLDWLADLESTGKEADEAIIIIIKSLGILVGFCWEQAFDGGVEAVAFSTPRPVVAEMVLATLVAVIVITPWRKHILFTVMKIEIAREQAEDRDRTELFEEPLSPRGSQIVAMRWSEVKASPVTSRSSEHDQLIFVADNPGDRRRVRV